MSWNSLKWIKLRVLCISAGFIFFLGLILFRSYELHISENARVGRLAQKQYHGLVPLNPKRGAVYDRNGQALALDIQVVSVAVQPGKIIDAEAAVGALTAATSVPAEKIWPKIEGGKKFEWIARRIPAETGEKLAKQKIPGIIVSPEYRRYYPNKEVAGNLLGAVGYDAKALGGVELALDSFLKSSPGSVMAEKDARGRFYTPMENQEVYHDVTLTLDLNIQFMAEKYLWEAASKYKVKSGFAMVMAPDTGEILAMANYPALNPNAYWKYPQDTWKNHAAIDTFEPGSIFKPVLAAAALASGKIKSTDVFNCENGAYAIGKRVIHDAHPHGRLTLSEIIQFSSNIGITKVAQKVGKIPFYDFMIDLGIGQSTGLFLPGEARGSLSPAQKWSDIEQSNISFGQGLAVSGLQMMQVYGAFANKGLRMKPYLVSKIESSTGGVVFENQPTPMGQVMKESVSSELTEMLNLVVDAEGTGTLAKIEGYPVAGKTGTAQKVNPETKAYDPHDFVSSFIGYVPASLPKYVIFVAYDSPRGAHYGGVVAAPVFRNIAREALAYAGVPPAVPQFAKALAGGLKEE
ncbi:MAG: penicillin-binding protein 2 [Deltaproteobacteria bacterium]|nr:penicillin-binding protein 2 [Deltaproteobacteria bacterium]